MAKCAVVDNITNRVVNIIIAEVTDGAPENCTLISADDIFVTIGMLWNGTTFIDDTPPPVEQPAPPPEEPPVQDPLP